MHDRGVIWWREAVFGGEPSEDFLRDWVISAVVSIFYILFGEFAFGRLFVPTRCDQDVENQKGKIISSNRT
jgi:hypothetical protein